MSVKHISKQRRPIVGLDLGTSRITVVVAETGAQGGVNILGVGTAPSRGVRKGVVINIEATVECIAQAVRQAETMAGVEIDRVTAAISGGHVKGFSSHGVVGVRGREVSAFDVERVIEAARAVAIPVDREILHVLPQEFVIDGQDGIKEPVGIAGVRLEARVHIVTSALTSGQNIVKCANRCGLVVDDLVAAPIATSRAVLTEEEQELGVCVVDIGGGTAEVGVFAGGAVRHLAVLPLGGNYLTNDIAAALRTPLAAAEDLKCRFASVAEDRTSLNVNTDRNGADLESDNDTIDVPSTGDRPSRVISRSVLSEVVRPRVHEMITAVQQELVQSGAKGAVGSGVVLTGGMAKLSGIEAFAESILGVSVRVGGPRAVAGLGELVASPEYATSVGLALHACSKVAGRPRHSDNVARRSIEKIGSWLARHF